MQMLAAFVWFGARQKNRSRKMRKAVHILWMVALAISVFSPTRSNAEDEHSHGAVFVMTNAVNRNEVISYNEPRMAPCKKIESLLPAVAAAVATTIRSDRKAP
jgi:hypothetical protein